MIFTANLKGEKGTPETIQEYEQGSSILRVSMSTIAEKLKQSGGTKE